MNHQSGEGYLAFLLPVVRTRDLVTPNRSGQKLAIHKNVEVQMSCYAALTRRRGSRKALLPAENCMAGDRRKGELAFLGDE
jgi:hypothetical protein